MNNKQIIQYIQNPFSIDNQTIVEIEKLLEKYPYFQTAHSLLIKGLKNVDDANLENQLKISAAHIGDRAKLFQLLHAVEKTTQAEKVEEIIEEVVAEITETQPQISDFETKEENIIPEETVNTTTFAEIATEVVEENKTASESILETSETPKVEEIEQKEDLISTQEFVAESLTAEEEKPAELEPVQAFTVTETTNEIQEEIKPEETPIVEVPAEEIKSESFETETIEEVKEEPQEAKSEESLADIILKRLQEIKDRDAEKNTENSEANSATEKVEEIIEEPAVQEEISVNLANNEETETENLIELDINLSESEEISEESTFTLLSQEDENTIDLSETTEQISINNEDEDLLDFGYVPSEEPKEENVIELIPEEPVAKKQPRATSDYYELPELDKSELDPTNLIDAFLVKQPRMQPKFEEVTQETIQEQKDISEESVKEGDYLSETLAKIFVAQKSYSKALDIYQKLSLKFPEKNTYFADRISEIQKKIK